MCRSELPIGATPYRMRSGFVHGHCHTCDQGSFTNLAIPAINLGLSLPIKSQLHRLDFACSACMRSRHMCTLVFFFFLTSYLFSSYHEKTMGRSEKPERSGWSRDAEGSTSGTKNGKGGSVPHQASRETTPMQSTHVGRRRCRVLRRSCRRRIARHRGPCAATPSRSSKNSDETVIPLDADAPPAYPVCMQDKLEDVLPHVPVSHDMERLLGEAMEDMARDDLAAKSVPPAMEDMAKHTSPSASDRAQKSSTATGSDRSRAIAFLSSQAS